MTGDFAYYPIINFSSENGCFAVVDKWSLQQSFNLYEQAYMDVKRSLFINIAGFMSFCS